jgi:hypothetical protein
VTPRRGDRVAPPPARDGYSIRFATGDVAKGWEELCRVAAANTRAAYDAMERNPCPRPATERQHQLKGSLSADTYGGKVLPQWQYEVTSGGRIWYLVDHDTRTCWLKFASPHHPKATD